MFIKNPGHYGFVFTPNCRINMNDFIFVSAKSKNYVRGETEWIDFYYIIINSLWFVSLYSYSIFFIYNLFEINTPCIYK